MGDGLARRILTGIYRPGVAAPSIRDLAAEFHTTRNTTARVLHELAARGLLERPRATESFRVRDVRSDAGVDAYRFLLDPVLMPDSAAAVFTEMLDILEGIVIDAVVGLLRGTRPVSRRWLSERLDSLPRDAVFDDGARIQTLTLAVEVLRELLALPQFGLQRAILNSLATALLNVPEAVRALVPERPDPYLPLWHALAATASFGGLSDAGITRASTLCRVYHRSAIERFQELIIERQGEAFGVDPAERGDIIGA
ncbi:GntR family transcriptional regulator [Nocardia yunnanensis]|uniref:GntR family transcriptional regulator n=1 Tax=Nocardia yunnanensis TaxID=2382165 RepID=A0A386ZJB1_9NOCA|nr:GntR family transcriptional regulator [Nocardia yunnanensis]AYF77952.1 GntR family transcriptional regulator [Nocardia yunnanensis]